MLRFFVVKSASSKTVSYEWNQYLSILPTRIIFIVTLAVGTVELFLYNKKTTNNSIKVNISTHNKTGEIYVDIKNY